jgi:hypothetical protein
MLKKLVSILLLTALIGSNLSRYLVVVSFRINRQYIVTNLCENRTKPLLHCNGKCFLAKKLKQADENEKKQSEKNELKNIEVCFFQTPHAAFSNLLLPELADARPTIFHSCGNLSYFVGTIFRPPRSVVCYS